MSVTHALPRSPEWHQSPPKWDWQAIRGRARLVFLRARFSAPYSSVLTSHVPKDDTRYTADHAAPFDGRKSMSVSMSLCRYALHRVVRGSLPLSPVRAGDGVTLTRRRGRSTSTGPLACSLALLASWFLDWFAVCVQDIPKARDTLRGTGME